MGNHRWKSFRSVYRETDLWIAVDTESYSETTVNYTSDRIRYYRNILDKYIRNHPEFRDSLVPVETGKNTHRIIREMSGAARKAGTGPMSAVAGAIAEFICKDLCKESGASEVIIENGGDIFLKLKNQATISVYAGNSPLSGKIRLVIKPEDTPLSVCTSSGTTGHSLSFGNADACTIACRSGALADAYATAFCNEVKDKTLAGPVTEKAIGTAGILAVVIIKDDKVSMGGSIEIRIL